MNNGERLDALLDEASERIGKRGDDLFEKYGVRTHWCLMMEIHSPQIDTFV